MGSFRAVPARGEIFLPLARDLRGPGPRAYFCRAAKVGKNALRKLRFLRTFLNYGGDCFFALILQSVRATGVRVWFLLRCVYFRMLI